MRTHPAVIAHAAATSAAMLEGRFFLGVGTGENLNEHVIGRGWPEIEIRNEMLVEAIEAIRLLFRGGYQTYRGRYYTVEDARLYTLPQEPPPILMAAGGPTAARIAAEVADGLVATAPDREVMEAFDEAGGAQKPRYAEVRVCWSASEAEARRLVHELWPTSALPGQVKLDIRLPRDFEQAVKLVRPEASTEHVPVGPDPAPYARAIREYADAGFDHVALHQVGPDQEGFFDFWRSELRSALEREAGIELAELRGGSQGEEIGRV
jgi:G6PDH family F420-dependent oxidoreductase